MAGDNLSRNDEFCEEITARLLQLGYEIEEGDGEALLFAANRTEERIKNLCNVYRIPDELEFKAVDMACGEFLSGKMVSGELGAYTEYGGRLIKTVAEGDTSVTYSDDAMKNTENFIKALCGSDSEIICCRRLKW